MKRWLVPAVVAAVLVAVFAADLALWREFVDERDAAVAAVADQRRLIVDAARSELRGRIDAKLADFEARARAIEADRLAPDEDLVLVADGAPVLPRPRAAPSPSPTAAEALFDAGLDAAHTPTAAKGGALAGTAATLAFAVRDAGDDDDLERAVRTFLEARAQERWTSSTSGAAALVVAKALVKSGNADPALVRALLIEGRAVGAARIVPVAVDVLNARDKGQLSAAGAERFAAALLQLCRDAGVDCARFRDRWREPAAPADAVLAAVDLTAAVERPAAGAAVAYARAGVVAVAGGRALYFEPTGDGAGRGALLDAARLSRDIAADLRGRSLLTTGDAVTLDLGAPAGAGGGHPTGARVALEDVPVALESPRLDAVAASAAARFRLKGGLLGLMTAMAGALAAGVVVDRRRRRRYDELRSGFVAAVSHELRTPLASMRLLVESMLARSSDDKAREKLARLERDVDGLDFLVENILSFSRLERGRLVPHRDRVSLAEVAAEAATRARADGNAVVTVDVDGDVDVSGDLELLQLVVTNLVRNAWQHNPRADKRVRVRVAGGPAGASVVVEDDGPGVAEADRERIFREFERGARAPSRGTGLGLALCRQIARAHGGDVALASTGPDGSKFVLTLPG